MKKKNHFTNFIKSGLTVLISVSIIYGVVQAGTITSPSGTPSAQFYTLSEIYEFIVNDTAATVEDHDFTFSDALAGTGKTLTEIYDALAGLITANQVKLGTTYLNVDGTLVPSGGDATVANVLIDKTFFGDSQTNWTLQTGTMADNSAFVLTCGVSDQAVTNGYYSGGTLTGDADLISTNIKSGINIFSVDGDSNVVDTSSGDAVAGDIANDKICWVDGLQITGSMFTNQKNQTIDDWVNSGGTSGEYIGEEATWSAVSGSPFAGYDSIDYVDTWGTLDLFSGAVMQDARTGLWWSDIVAIDGGGTASTTDNIFTLTGVAGVGDGTRPTGGNAIGFCDALNTANFGGHNDWYLPTQKQLMQAYIDGLANNLPNLGINFWSSTEYSNNTAVAWYVYLSSGHTYISIKVNKCYARCVRP
ncbi:MAG: DUF1566 domain-containing protein [bacterium]